MAILNGETLIFPVEIAPNLCAGVRVGGGWITIDYSPLPADPGCQRFRSTIIFPVGEGLPDLDDYSDDGLQSGVGGCDLSEAMSNLLGFMGAAAESRQYRERTGRAGENEDLFPPHVVDFVSQYSDEIGMLAYEIEEQLNQRRAD